LAAKLEKAGEKIAMDLDGDSTMRGTAGSLGASFVEIQGILSL